MRYTFHHAHLTQFANICWLVVYVGWCGMRDETWINVVDKSLLFCRECLD